MRLRLFELAAIVSLPLCTKVARGQTTQGSFEIGGVGLRYADTLNAAAATLTPEFRLDWPRVTTEGSGTLSQFRSGAWTTQGELSTSVFTPQASDLLGELSGSLGGSAHQDGTRTGQSIANVRIHYLHRQLGAFVGAGGGALWDGAGWGRLLQGDVGVWVRSDRNMAQLTISPVSINDSIKYTDAQLALSWRLERLDLSGVAGTRKGRVFPAIGSTAKSWGSITAVTWLTPSIGFVASGGAYPVDFTQGFPGGRFVSFALRFAFARRPRETSSPREPFGSQSVAGAPSPAEVSGFEVERRPQGLMMLTVRARTAEVVELTGDFTNWVPVQLRRSGDGAWTTVLPIKPGKYEMNVRIDGGKWLVPPGLLALSDEFGGTVGLLVIE